MNIIERIDDAIKRGADIKSCDHERRHHFGRACGMIEAAREVSWFRDGEMNTVLERLRAAAKSLETVTAPTLNPDTEAAIKAEVLGSPDPYEPK